jgi:peroxiredoxin
MTDLWMISHLAQWGLLLVVLALAVGALRQIGFLYQRVYPYLDHLRLGESLQDITLSTLAGSAVRISSLVSQQTTFLVVSPGCSGCHRALQQLRSQDADSAAEGNTVVIGVGTADTVADMVSPVQLPQSIEVLVDSDGKTKHEWGVSATPTLIVVDEKMQMHQLHKGVVPSPPGASGADSERLPTLMAVGGERG